MTDYLQYRSDNEENTQVDVLAEIAVGKSGQQPAAKSRSISKPISELLPNNQMEAGLS